MEGRERGWEGGGDKTRVGETMRACCLIMPKAQSMQLGTYHDDCRLLAREEVGALCFLLAGCLLVCSCDGMGMGEAKEE